MSISAQTTHSSVKPDPRQRNRRTSDIELQAYAAVGRRFAEGGPVSKRRTLRVVLGAAASVTVLLLVALVGLLTYENINSPHARKVAATAKGAQAEADVALAAGKPVIIIDEKEEAPARPVVAPAPVPPLVLLAPEALKESPPAAPARLATATRTPLKLREPARSALAAGKLAAAKTGKAAQQPAARKGARKNAPSSPVKRKVAVAPVNAADGGPLDTLLSHASVQRRYLAQPLPLIAARLHPPRRPPLSEP